MEGLLVGCDEGSRDGIWVGIDVGVVEGSMEMVGDSES